MTIILNHLGCPVGPAMSAEDFARWKRDLAELAECANVVCKCGGIAMPVNGELRRRLHALCHRTRAILSVLLLSPAATWP